MNAFNLFDTIIQSPLFWGLWLALSFYIGYRLIRYRTWVSGYRKQIEWTFEGITAFLTGYIFHIGVLDIIIIATNNKSIIDSIWILALFCLILYSWHKLYKTKHFETWGYLLILFGLGCLVRAFVLIAMMG